jgi:hypothetical protein
MNDRDIEYRRTILVRGTTIDELGPTEYAAVRDADLVIVSSTHRVIKDRYGVPGRIATSDEINRAEVIA